MNIKKITKNSILAVLLLAPLSTFALFDWGHDDYYDRPHVFGRHYRGSYYRDRELDRLERLERETQLREKELELREKEAQLRGEGQMPVAKQKPAPKK